MGTARKTQQAMVALWTSMIMDGNEDGNENLESQIKLQFLK